MLAKLLDDKLKPLAINQYTTITDTFETVNHSLTLKDGDVLVSYDVLFTNVPLEETINILADQAFTNDWFNQTHHFNLSKQDLIHLLEGAPNDQRFLFIGQLYEEALHYKSHVDDRYKRGPLTTMLDRAFRLSSNWTYFSEECDRLKLLVSRLEYPDDLINSTVTGFIAIKASEQP